MILTILLIIISSIISSLGVIYIFINHENFGTFLNNLMNILMYLFFGVFFFTFYMLSTEIVFKEEITVIIWRILITIWVFSISLLSIVHRFIIKYEKKAILTSFLYSFIVGMILGLNFLFNSIKIKQGTANYRIVFQNSLLLIFLLIYNSMVLFIIWYNLLRYFSSIRDQKSKKFLCFLTFHFSLIIFFFSLNLITQNVIFRDFYIAIYLMGAIFATYIIIKRPFLFIELTNKIFDFIIFHRSGILLYSYNFETGEETDDSLLKGSILIGINHILTNFIDKKDQLSLIKMQNRDIILEYDTKHGYALLLTANHHNFYIQKAVSNFMKRFTYVNKEKLQNLNGLIDITEFKNAKSIITEFFEPYI